MIRLDTAKRFGRTEDGSITVEAVLWLPFFMLFMTFIADVALILNGQAQVQRIVQDANRGYSIGLYDDTDEVEAIVEARMAGLTPGATAETEEVDGIVRTTITMSASDLVAVGLITKIANVDLSFASYHIVES